MTMEHFKQTITANYRLRTEMFNGRKHIVAPVVLMVPGVHNGSKGPTLYTAEELSKYTAAWNGRPVPVFHPEDSYGPVSCNDPQILEQQTIGHLFNVHYNDDKLKGEIWIDEEKASHISPTALAYIRQGRQLEVSTGVFTDDEPVTGEWNGEYYEQIAHNLRPDHLALLPGDVQGACSWSDGCGVRVNQDKGGDLIDKEQNKQDQNIVDPVNNQEGKEVQTMKRTKPVGSGNTEEPTVPTELSVNQMASQIKDYIKQGYAVTVLESGYRDTVSKLQTYMDSLDNDYKIHFVEEVYDDYVIYAIENRETGNRKLYKRGYTINDDGTVSLSDDVQEVVRETSYKEVEVTTNRQPEPAANETEGQTEPQANTNDNETQGGNINMEKVDKLIQNESTKFTEDDREWLSALSECQLDKLEPVKQEPTTNQEPAIINQEQAVQAVKEQFKSPDQFLQLLPDEYRDQFEHGLALHNQKREELISRITANTELYPAEELRSYKTKELERLANVVKPKANYSPMGSGDNPAVNATGPEPLLPLGVEVQKSQ